MATPNLLLKQVNDITECSVCFGTMVDPKMLPCTHTFCLECLEKLCKNKRPGVKVKVPCPECRREFGIPSEGIGKLQSNIVIRKLIDAQKASSRDELAGCDICLCRKIRTPAINSCVECEQNFCSQCSEAHLFMTSSMFHRLKTPVDPSKLGKRNVTFSGTYQCDMHDGKQLEIYCMDCKVAICTVCFLKEHKQHRKSDVTEFVKEQKRRMAENVDMIARRSLEANKQLKALDLSLKQFSGIAAGTERVIMKKSEELKRMVDDHVAVLLRKLNLSMSEYMRKLTTAKEELQCRKLRLNSYATYAEVFKTASPSYIASVAQELNNRASELTTLENVNTEIRSQVTLIPSDLQEFTTAWKALIEKIDIRENTFLGRTIAKEPTYLQDPKLITTIQFRKVVRGEVVVGQDLYVVTTKSSRVQVFDVDTSEFKTEFPVKGLTDPYGITAYGQSLFISNYEDCSIYRVDMPDRSVNSWKVGHYASTNRLSITKQGNVLVTMMEMNKLCEYTTSGTFVRAIPLDPTMYGPRHAIHLDGDRFLFSHAMDGGSHRVCIIDRSGMLIEQYGGKAGLGTGELFSPRQMAVDRNGFVFVTCMDGGKVVLLDSNLKFVKDIIPASADLIHPYTVCLDETRWNLYVSDFNNQDTISKFQLN